jgi:hypothetical protein
MRFYPRSELGSTVTAAAAAARGSRGGNRERVSEIAVPYTLV